MNLSIKDQLFLVTGATSGFGKAVAEALIAEGAKIIAVARGAEKLKEMTQEYPGKIETVSCDITQPDCMNEIVRIVDSRQVHGILVNAGGPPAMSSLEAKLEDWDKAYKTILRWKVDLMQRLLPAMIGKKYGRIVFIESVSVKQPIENLVLSNSLRLAVVGYAKTVSQEIAGFGVTLNILAPGFHNTAAMERIYKKSNEVNGISREAATQQFINQTGVGFLGDPAEFASLAIWLLSPISRYITGQTISVDGGVVKGVMG